MRSNTRARTEGQSLAEYGLILALIAVVAIGGLNMLGGSIQTQLVSLATSITKVSTANETSAPTTATIAGNGCSGSGCAVDSNLGW